MGKGGYILGGKVRFWDGRVSMFKKGCIFLEGWEDSASVAYKPSSEKNRA